MGFFHRNNSLRGYEIDDAVLTITEKDAARLEPEINRQGEKWFRGVSLGILLVLAVRLGYLVMIRGAFYQDLSAGNNIRNIFLPAPRGIIYDRTGSALVQNVPSLELVVTPANLPDTDDDRRALSERLRSVFSFDDGEPEKTILSLDDDLGSPIVLKASVSQDESLLFSTRLTEFPGVTLERSAIRQYADGTVFSHILGYEGKVFAEDLEAHPEYFPTDFIGRQGIEKSYEATLRGRRGAERVEVDSLGRIRKALGTSDPEQGSDIILTIDAGLQHVLFDALSSELSSKDLRRGVGIAIDPRDGSILALVSLPSFDNNLFAKGISGSDYDGLLHDDALPLFNRAIAGEYPPGSTIKPLIASAALAEHVISPDKQIESRGGISIGKFFFGDWKAHGFTDIRRAIAVSSDVYFYSVGGGYGEVSGLGMDRMKRYESLFGYGSELGIDIPGEKDGFLPDPAWKQERFGERWYIGDDYHAAIGQGYVLATPLQVLDSIATVANGGTLWKPHLVGEIRKPDGTEEKIEPNAIHERVVDPSILRIVREGMRLTVTEGTAQSLRDLPVQVAGKTGTAQFGSGKDTHGWFVSFAPYEHPEIALVILVEGQDEEGYNAVPVTKKVYEWYFTRNKQQTTDH